MGVPSEGGEDSEVDDNDESRRTESTEYGLPTVDADAEEEAEEDTTSTQFGLPSVDEDEEILEPDDETPTPVPHEETSREETPTPVPQTPGEDDPQKTGNWTGWEEEVGDEPSDESVLSAWGISAEEETSSPEPPEDQAKYATQEFDAAAADEEEESPVVEGKLKTQMGMPQVDRQGGEASSPTLADVSSPTRRETDALGAGRTEEFQIDSMDELERQVRDLRTESEVEDADETGAEEGDALNDAESSGAGIVSKPDESNAGAAESGVVSGAPGLESDSDGESSGLGPGAYSQSEGERGDEANSSGVLGGGTYRKNDVEPDESGGLPSPSEIGAGGSSEDQEGASEAESSAERRDGSSLGGAEDGGAELETHRDGSGEAGRSEETDESGAREFESTSPDESGLVTEREGPTGFEVDRSDDELSIPDGVQGEAGQRLGDDIPDDDGGEASRKPGDEPERTLDLQGEEAGAEPSGPPEAESEDKSESELELETVDEKESAVSEEVASTDTSDRDREPESGAPKPGAAAEEGEAESGDGGIRDDQGEADEESRPDIDNDVSDGGDREKSEEAEAAERETTSSAPPESRASGEEKATSGADAGGTEEADCRETTPANEDSKDDDLSHYAMLTQTVCGLIAGISFGMAVLVQMLTGEPGAEILLLSLLLASGIGAVASIVLPFVPFDGALRGALYLGFGVLIAALGVSAMMVSTGGLAVGPIVALFGSIFALVAGAVPHVVTALEE